MERLPGMAERTGIIAKMAVKAKIYTEKNYPADADLITQLKEAVDRLEESSRAVVPISKARCVVGYGVDKSQRSIEADSVISIAKAIKNLGGW